MPACPHLDRLDAYLDGALAPWEAAAFERHAAGCAACAAEMALARRVLDLLHATPPETAPAAVLDGALARIAAAPARRTLLPGRRADRPALRLVPVTRFRATVFALAASAVLAALAVAPLLRPRPVAEPPPPSAAEVARARADVERALGLVGEATRDAGLFLRDDVLAPHVAAPAAESVLDALGLSD